MEMLFRGLTGLVVLVHFAFVVFVVVGVIFVMRWPRLVWFHVPAVIWGLLIEFAGVICPLTPLEKWFRSLAGQEVYQGGFINHYIMPVLYPEGLTRDTQIVLGVLLAVINIAGYLWLLARRRRSRAESGNGG